MPRTDLATSITLTNNEVVEIKFCIGLNFTNGTPSDYGVRTADGKALIIPRENVLHFQLPTEFRFPGEVAA